jgi:hypothetical protein
MFTCGAIRAVARDVYIVKSDIEERNELTTATAAISTSLIRAYAMRVQLP